MMSIPKFPTILHHDAAKLIRDYFLSFEQFPWFRKATLAQLFAVELHHADHLYWSELDVDLDLDRIAHPEKYPLIAK